MEKGLVIEPGNFGCEIHFDNINEKFKIRDYLEDLSSTESDIKLYEVTYNEEFEEEKKELIATIEGRFFDIIYAINNEINLFEVFDMPDQVSANLIPYLLDDDGDIKDEFNSLNLNIFYLDNIYVEKKYRNKGYATFILNNLADILTYICKISVGTIIIEPVPLEKVNNEYHYNPEDQEMIDKLIQLCEKSGYKRINNSNYLASCTNSVGLMSR